MRQRSLAIALALSLLMVTPAEAGKRASKAVAAKPKVELTTSMGKIVLELDAKRAPVTVANFLRYVKKGFYNGTIFHRVIPSFMIQGGGMTPGMSEKPTEKPIRNEADNGLKNARGTVAMARTGDPHSASAQFFINLKNNGFLNHRSKDSRGWGYAVFGKVIKGMETVEQIRVVPTNRRGPHAAVPTQPVLIKKARIL